MANTAGTGSSFTGTASADIIVAEETGITGATTDTINGLAGNDVIFGDHDELFVDAGAGNATIGTAIDINDETLWSTKANPDVGDTSVPYTSVLATGANELDYFKVTVGAGQTITVDLDYGFGPYGGPSFDSVVRLVDINGGELAYNDDSDITEGGRGSSPITGTLSRDSYFTFTNTGGLALNYFIEVGRFNGEGLPGDVVTSGATYMLNVSVTGHANTNIAAFSADIINGGDDNDILYGLDGDDTINGGAGDDLIIGGAGADAIDGGTGTDTLSYEDASAGVRSGEGALIQDGDAQGDTLTSIENYIGSQFNDILSDFDANEANVIYGLGGDDSLRGLTGQDQLFGGDGDDTLQISDGEAEAGEVYDGGAQNFFDQLALFGNGSSDFDFTTSTVVDIEQLNFVAQLGGGATAHFLASQINGGINRYVADARVGVGQAVTVDIFMGTETALDLSGASVTAFTYAGDGFVITGDDSSETIRGTSVNDTLNGNSGDDVLEGGPGADAINGGAGLNDTASYEHSSAGVTVVVGGAISGGDAAGDTLSGIENLTGSNSDDILAIGGSGDNILRGLGGRDVLVGDGGQDQVFGGAGDDELQIQSGDVVAGEVYDGGTQDNFDQLTFFSNSVADVYDFRATTVTGIERLYFSNNVGGGASIQFDAAQIKGGIGLFFAEERTGSNNQIVIQIDMGTETTLDLSGASIGGFTYAGDGFAVTGDAASETITGSSVDDTLEGGAGGDNLNGSTGNDTASY
ncbi:MAG: calcium-binding protein, partial [Rhodobiaceae bacterium]|nr:calcium-binding protein [Rhodobiaceae bacterium]